MAMENTMMSTSGGENVDMMKNAVNGSDVDMMAVGEKYDITGDGGIVKEILKLGEGTETPEKGDTVWVHYVGTLESDGTEFDSSRSRGDPFSFVVGQGSVIKGWDLGVPTMKKGEVSKLIIRSDYGYGDAGSPPKIPGGATLVFEVELMSWKSVKDIMGDGGIIKTIVKEGEGWAQPKDDDEVTIHLTASLPGESKPFFSTPAEGAEFTVKDGFFCEAVANTVKTTKKGEQAKLIVKSNYAFGDEGYENGKVPPGSNIEMSITTENWKKVEKVTPDGKVLKKTLVESNEWQRPNAGATVTVSYTATGIDGSILEEKTESDPAEFVVEEEQAPCEGLELAIMKMKKEERALVTVSAPYTPSEVEQIVYDVKLIDFVKAKETWEMSTEEKLEAAKKSKDKGNEAFKAGKNDKAIKLWDRAKQSIEYDDSFDADSKALAKEIKRSCHLNLAAAHLKNGNYKEACKESSKILDSDSFHMKALYRRAQAYIGLGDWVEAAQDIKKALGVDPKSMDFRVLAKKLKAAESESSKTQAALWSQSFAKMAATRSKLETSSINDNNENGKPSEVAA